jgi:hypothetical protein
MKEKGKHCDERKLGWGRKRMVAEEGRETEEK